MYLHFLIVSSVLINFIAATDKYYVSKDVNENKALMGTIERIKSNEYPPWNQHHWKPHKRSPYNITYIDKAENMIRLPEITNYYKDKKNKKKTVKKSPRRTIQKIIKKSNKSRIKKLYVVKMTSKPTVIPKYDFDNDDEYSSRNAEKYMTTRPNQQRKIKKYSVKQVKLPRYPLPYKQMQRKNTFIRPKRDANNLFIFKDFDSMQVVQKGKKDDDEYNVVNAHFKKYW